MILVRADNSLASKVANGATFRSASMDCSSFHASLTHLKALSGSVDAATTASRVLILQFLYVSASGKAGILIESASLTLGLSSDLGSMFPPRNLMSLRLNFWSLSSSLPSPPPPSPPSGGPGLPFGLLPLLPFESGLFPFGGFGGLSPGPPFPASRSGGSSSPSPPSSPGSYPLRSAKPGSVGE